MPRLLVTLLAVLAVAPATAGAAVVEISVLPADGADFGETQSVAGRLTGPYGAPVVGQKVVLEARRYPFRGSFSGPGTATTGLDGRFAFERAFDRNHQVRVLAPAFGDRSAVQPVYVFPRSNLTFRLVRRNVIRLTQVYATPRDVRLTKPTLFYVGRRGTGTAPLAARARTRRIRRGHFIARALVRIPQAWHGRFRYASCFPYNAGMGDPKIGCPSKQYRF
ncbi:MAG TPA: hypothetical protein VES79_03555 [Solirubrobacteraceae bacterium]|nr:hypothetical protein [Solirubrobacteraceae bacterium]